MNPTPHRATAANGAPLSTSGSAPAIGSGAAPDTTPPGRVIAVTPGPWLAPGIAIAAVRAGATGILDLGGAAGHDDGARRDAIAALIQGCAGRAACWGLRWDAAVPGRHAPASALAPLEALLGAAQAAAVIMPPVLLLAGIAPQQLAAARERARPLARAVLLEVRDLDAALAAQAAGYDGVVVKGHEAGGHVSPRSSFILLQELAGRLELPYWIQGGAGPHTGAAAVLAGAAGVVLCEQLWLAAEGPFGPHAGSAREPWLHLDGSETVLAGAAAGDTLVRLSSRSGRARLARIALAQAGGDAGRQQLERELAEGLAGGLAGGSATGADALLALGQDIALAPLLARRHGTVGRIVTALGRAIDDGIALAASQAALAPDGPLARSHGTRYAVAQGPMTRVSDVAPFALAVADGGALPFLALAVMRGPQARAMLERTSELLDGRPWGVGVLGFMPLEMRQEQMAAIRATRPPFAVIAGGRPSQARELEQIGIATYLHVPSPGLLRQFLKEGARRFVFEGSECGGHTGPRTSFALWETMLGTLLEADIKDPETLRIMFAGGIHDALSSAMVAALAAPLVARGAQVGVWMGTAYLFTEEIVGAGAVVPEFQRQAIACRDTALLQSGVGVYTRCADTPFCAEFEQVRRRMVLAASSEEETLLALETMNIGRLRIAAKGVTRNTDPASAAARRYIDVDADTQRREGIYMLGDVARLRDRTCAIAALHEEVSDGAMALLASAAAPATDTAPPPPRRHDDIAIVGMACLFPGAQDLRQYWENILRGVDAVSEVDPQRWDAALLFDAKRGTPDKVYATRGGFLDDIAFDPQRYGIVPSSLAAIEPMQLLALEVARQALDDAFATRPFDRERTACVFAVGGMADLSCQYNFRTLLPLYLDRIDGLAPEVRQQILTTLNRDVLPQWSEDAFPGILGNVVAGRIANRLDLGGTNFTVDAACAASLAALDVGIKQLRSGEADVALAGGVDCTNGAIGFMCFSQTHALSPRGRSQPFDTDADGIAISEGVGAVVLKRLADAERDGDRIYALIKGIGSSSDGRNRSLTAPHPAGQVLALRRAYADAGVDPAGVGLIEAHGTGTALGDKSELKALQAAFGDAMAPQSCALGSVKSMIGHTKVAAGMAGLIKSALALQQRVLPPTIGIVRPTAAIDFARSPFYLNSEARPWLAGAGQPRHCGVSAFGFGGTNFHAVLAEYRGGAASADSLAPREVEIFAFCAASREQIALDARRLLDALAPAQARQRDLAPLACALYREQYAARAGDDDGARHCRLVLLAGSIDELRSRLQRALELLALHAEIRQPPGLYYREGRGDDSGAVCFLFPGQGSQRVNMLRELVTATPALHACFAQQVTAAGPGVPPVSAAIYPAPAFDDAARDAQQQALNATEVAQPALGMAGMAAYRLLTGYGLKPDLAAGHSYGEYVALWAAGALGTDDLLRLSLLRGRVAASAPPGAMAVLDGDGAQVAAAIARHGLAVSIANLNAPTQTIVAGGAAAIDAAIAALSADGMRVRKLPVSAAFHCASMDGARQPLAAGLADAVLAAPRIPVYSNTTAAPHGGDPDAMRHLLARHIAEPVRFVEQVEAMYRAGARVFIECGPGAVLGGLVDAILGQRPHATLALDAPGRPGWQQLAQLLAQALALGLPVDLAPWFDGRALEQGGVAQLLQGAARRASPGPLAWRVNGGRAAPWRGAARPAAPPPHPVAATSATAASPPPAPLPAPAAPPLPSIPHRRNTMMSDEFASQPRQLPPASPHHQVSEIQQGLARLLDLQYEQQMSLRHFLDFQARLAGFGGDAPPALALPAPLHAAMPAPQVHLVQPAHHLPPIAPPLPGPALPPAPPVALAAVPRAPVLPPQLAQMAQSVQPAAPAAPAAPVAAASASVPAQAQGLAVAGADEFKAELLKAVSERTGYPVDMLDLDAHMEADLGIDSIKRIEIFSGLTTRYNLIGERDEEAVIAELSGYKTLNEIAAWYARTLAPPAAPESEQQHATGVSLPKKAPAPPSPQPETMEPAAAADPVVCYVVHATLDDGDVAADHVPPDLPRGLPVLLTGADGPLAGMLRRELERLGYTVLQAIPGNATRRIGAGRCAVDLSSEQSVRAWRALDGEAPRPLGALINLVGAGAGGELAHAGDARATFLLLKVLEADLKAGAAGGGGWLLNLTQLDGQFGLGRSRELAAGSAGTLGVAKSAAREWPAVRVKCVDIAPELDADPRALALRVLAEIGGADRAVEIGLTQRGRWRIGLQADAAWHEPPSGPAPAPASAHARHGPAAALPALEPGAVVLVTGGAYGITADIGCTLAARYRPRMVLVGRSALPGDETPDTRDIADPAALKRLLIAQLREGGARVMPAQVDATLKRLLRERQIRANLAAMRDAGAEVEYHSVDVRDGAALAALLDDVYRRHGRIDGVLHGAGVIGDKLIGDKTAASFDAVFDTKVTPALVLANRLRPDSLRFIAFFSSVAGRFGNVGQCDYSAANEVLNKLADTLAYRWPHVRALAVNWGPWDAGMVDDGLRKLYALRAILPIPVADGRRHFMREIERAGGGPRPELVITASMRAIAALQAAH